jgi:hypothetical protein
VINWVQDSESLELRTASTGLLALMCTEKEVGDKAISSHVGITVVCVCVLLVASCFLLLVGLPV